MTEGSLQNSDNVFCFALVLLLCMALLTCAQFANGSQSQRWNRARRENCFNIWQNFSPAAFKILPFPNQVRLTWILAQRIESDITSLFMLAHPHEGSLPIQKPDNICLEVRCYPLISNPFAERTCVWGKSDRDILRFLILINNPPHMKEEGSLFHSGLQFRKRTNTKIRE